MAQMDFHSSANNWYAQLNAAVGAADLSMVLKDSGASGAPAVPFLIDGGTQELMRCTQIQADTPSAGLDTLTIEREVEGAATTYAADGWIEHNYYAQQATELQKRLAALERVVMDMLGGSEGVQETSSGTDLKVAAQGSPDMTVKVQAGAAVVNGQMLSLADDVDTDEMTAPTGNPRIDIVQITWQDALDDPVVDVKAGAEAGSPSAPSVDAGYLKLAEIYHRVGETSIKNTDDSTNGYISDDSRVFL